MFGFGKKKNKEKVLYAVAKGQVKPISEVKDPVFSQKMMGDGFAVSPENNAVFAPVEGTVIAVFPTKHAMTFKTSDGVDVLVHIGLDTVSLDGEGFNILVSENQEVTPQTQIAEVDFDLLKEKGLETDIIVALPDSGAVIDKLQLGVTDAGAKASEYK